MKIEPRAAYSLLTLAPDSGHLPDLKTIDGVLNLLSLCWLVILGNVIDPRTYNPPNRSNSSSNLNPANEEDYRKLHEEDFNDIPIHERINMSYARGISYSLVRWLDSHYVIQGLTLPFKEHESFAVQFIASESAKFVSFCKLGHSRKLEALGNADLKSVTSQVENVMENQLMRSAWRDLKTSATSKSLYLGLTAKEKASLTVVQRAEPLNFHGQFTYSSSCSSCFHCCSNTSSVASDFMIAGTTPLDRKRLLVRS